MPDRPRQMSEAFSTSLFLLLSGGFQDAYTYQVRGGVFANAQTGNIVLLSAALFEGRWAAALGCLVPLCAFAAGVFAAEWVRTRFWQLSILHWRQLVVALEMALLLGVGFLPARYNGLANALVSFVCAMQVQSFRKVNGCAYASTMCVGNLRSAAHHLYLAAHTKSTVELAQCGQYFAVIAVFALGAGLGSVCSARWGLQAIWACPLLLACSLLLMCRRPGSA